MFKSLDNLEIYWKLLNKSFSTESVDTPTLNLVVKLADFLPTHHQHKVDVSVCYAWYVISFFSVSLTEIEKAEEEETETRQDARGAKPHRAGPAAGSGTKLWSGQTARVRRRVVPLADPVGKADNLEFEQTGSVKRWDEVKRNSKKGATLITYVLFATRASFLIPLQALFPVYPTGPASVKSYGFLPEMFIYIRFETADSISGFEMKFYIVENVCCSTECARIQRSC